MERLIQKLEYTGTTLMYPHTQPDNPDYEYDVSCIQGGIRGKFGDTFPMTWGPDGEIYTSAGDPCWGKKNSGLDVEQFSGMPPRYKIRKLNEMPDCEGWGGGGPKPTGMISIKGVLYFAIQNFYGFKPPVWGSNCQHGTDATILCSKDYGKTWAPNYRDIKEPMFPGATFGGPVFINFGKDNANARDGYVYAVSGDQWDNGSDLRLGRASEDKIMERNAWEFAIEVDKNSNVKWDKDLDKAVSILHADKKLSLPDMVYVAPLKRYLLLTWSWHLDFEAALGAALYIYESPEPWGPFELVHYEPMWEDNRSNPYVMPYNPRIPLKWMAADGLSGWLQFSGAGITVLKKKSPLHYLSHVRPFRFVLNK